MQRFLVPLFTFVWWKRLNEEKEYSYPVKSGITYRHRIHIVKVKGWRTALVDRPGYGRETITFCFWWFK